MSRRGFSWRAPPDNPAPRAECPWCGEVKSRAALDSGGHRETRGCIAKGHELRANERALVRIGALVDDDSWRVRDWLPIILRGRAPFEILPTRAKRKGNQCTPRYRDGKWVEPWYDAREVWIPRWVNLFLAGSVERDSEDDEPRDARTLFALFRWAGKDDANARALAFVYASSPQPTSNDLQARRARLLELFFAANPSKRRD